MDKIIAGESRFVEFKEKLPKSETLAKSVIAFSNGAGGKIFIGVSDTGEIKGVNDGELFDIQDKISDIIHTLCFPVIIPDIYVENLEGKNIIVIHVFPGNLPPYYLKSHNKNNGTYVRVGAENKQADHEFITELERKRLNIGFDETINYTFPLEHIDWTYLKKAFLEKKNQTLTTQTLRNLNLTKSENGTEYPTNAFLILSGLSENTATDCARFKGTTNTVFLDKKEFTGNLISQIESVEVFLRTHLNNSAEINGFIREDKLEIPVEALREAVLNAFVHRNYGRLGANIKIAIYDDIVEINSPGVLPASINLYDIFTSRRSEIRNKVLARIFKELGYIEQWGSGMGRIAELCKAEGLIQPQIIEKGNFIQFIFHRKTNNTDKTPIYNTDTILNSSEEKVILYLETNKSINNQKTREITGLTADGVKSLLQRLTEKGLLIKQGEKKGTRYHLKSR